MGSNSVYSSDKFSQVPSSLEHFTYITWLILGFLFYRYSSCDGADCCQSTITSGLQAYSIAFNPLEDENTSEGCKYAFIAEQQWLLQNPTDLDALRDLGFVSALLDWAVDGSSLTKMGLSTSSYAFPYTCEAYSPSTNLPRSLYTCYCKQGYLGNALLNNCQGRMRFLPLKLDWVIWFCQLLKTQMRNSCLRFI